MAYEERAESGSGIGLTRDYRRLPAVESEIAALPEVTDPAFWTAVRSAAALETLVHALRRLKRSGDEAGVQQIAGLLIDRVKSLLARAAAAQIVVSVADREDIEQIAAGQMWRELLETGPSQEFWEVNFHHIIFLACFDAANAIRSQREHEQQFERGDDEEGEPFDEEAEVADPDSAELNLVEVEALAQLDGDVRRAVYLRMHGFPERSRDPNKVTIAKILGVSDRTVRSHLAKARPVLRAWLDSKEPAPGV